MRLTETSKTESREVRAEIGIRLHSIVCITRLRAGMLSYFFAHHLEDSSTIARQYATDLSATVLASNTPAINRRRVALNPRKLQTTDKLRLKDVCLPKLPNLAYRKRRISNIPDSLH